MKVKLHRDGTISWWSVYIQGWRKSRVVSDKELSTLSRSERVRILRHMAKHN